MGAEFLFMDDNARPHRANIVDECLHPEDIPCMDWPEYSPDLNPIEHVWDMLGRRSAARVPPPTGLPEHRRALLDEWCNIPQDQIDNLLLSMPRRCVSQIQQRKSAECPAVYMTTLDLLHVADGRDRYTWHFKYPHCQKSAVVRCGDQGDDGNLQRLLMTLSSPIVCIKTSLTVVAE
ncbi:transposable element Tcb1 transposase [Trichonephila clavipes]|nr:transposable element Tcb1 transposase [Trichonephila clavipes]